MLANAQNNNASAGRRQAAATQDAAWQRQTTTAVPCKLPQKTVGEPLQCLSESQHMNPTLMGPIIPWKAPVRVHALLPVAPLTYLLTRVGDLLTWQSKKPAGPPDHTEHSTRNTSQKTLKTSENKQQQKTHNPPKNHLHKKDDLKIHFVHLFAVYVSQVNFGGQDAAFTLRSNRTTFISL